MPNESVTPEIISGDTVLELFVNSVGKIMDACRSYDETLEKSGRTPDERDYRAIIKNLMMLSHILSILPQTVESDGVFLAGPGGARKLSDLEETRFLETGKLFDQH